MDSKRSSPQKEVGVVARMFYHEYVNVPFFGQLVGGEGMRQVIIYPGEDGYWVAECPSLPGCISQGKTKEEAIANIKEAIQVYVSALEADHLPVPEEHFEALLVAV
jgi:predicted RNase H-like HicB family nuclease